MVLLNLIRNLDPVKYDIYLLPVYEFNKEFAEPIIDKVSLLKGLNFYFRGLEPGLSGGCRLQLRPRDQPDLERRDRGLQKTAEEAALPDP